MDFRTATLLVLGMFGSFAVVITTIMFLFWSPGGKKTERQQKAAIETPRQSGTDQGRDVLIQVDTTKISAEAQPVTQIPDPEPATKLPEPPGSTPAEEKNATLSRPVNPPGRMTQKKLKIEQDEMKQLRSEMERRLKERTLNQEKKLDQLARRCETLGAGEAVQILTILEDSDLSKVLERMNREKALQIAALLTRLGRGNAIPLK
jgi:flagellar motility protein MotE (MotC chaperone)